MYTVFLLFHVMIAIGLIVLVLLQQGRGAEAGAAFGGGGASATMFGSRGSGSFLSRVTAILATGFFLTSLILAYFATQSVSPTSVTEQLSPVSAEVQTEEEESATDPLDVPKVPQSPGN